MGEKSTAFEQACQLSFDEEHWQKINYSTSCYERNYAKSLAHYRNIELEKQRAYKYRNRSILNLEKLLVDFETHFTDNGGTVLWARHADDALQMIDDIIAKSGARFVARSNSSVLDEIGLNNHLKKKSIDLVETNIGRFILNVGRMAPYHPMFTTINLSKEEINGVLTEHFKLKSSSTSRQMVNFIRYQLSQQIADCNVSITGANFLIADTGGVVITENEGNILNATNTSKINIVVAGIAKVITSAEDLSVLLPLLSMHAQGQRMATINSITYGPSLMQGDENMIVILLDNGRTRVLVDEKQRQIMSCIHCEACASVCPVYKNIGGYAYNSPYMGPLGIIMTPLKEGTKKYQHLASACSLCRRCTEICPVGIPLDNLILENRHIIANEQVGDPKAEALFKTMIRHCKSRKRLDCPLWLKKIEVKRFFPKSGSEPLPQFAPKSFSQMWKDGEVI